VTFSSASLLALTAREALPAIDATLNAVATGLLLLGYALIKRRHERAHKLTMLAAFGVSVAFLTCYLWYHFGVLKGERGTPFGGPPPISYVYYSVLISHILLAALVPFLALTTIYLGLRDRRAAHRKLARWTYPIWLYVSVTGVVIYVALYHVYPAAPSGPIIVQ
jgi:putative membrane protein